MPKKIQSKSKRKIQKECEVVEVKKCRMPNKIYCLLKRYKGSEFYYTKFGILQAMNYTNEMNNRKAK